MEPFYTYLWKSAIILALFYGFYKFFLHKETYFQSIRYFLLSGIALAFTLPLVIVPIHTDSESIPLSQIATNTIANLNSAVTTESPADWPTLLLFSYLAISSVFFIRFIFQLLSITNIILNNKRIKIGNYYYIETTGETSPFSFFNFIVYNPTTFNKNELAQIIAHEKIHAIQKHSLDTLLSNLLIIIQWYNPISWLYKKNVEQNLEFIADEYAQKKSTSQQSYQQLLLKTSIPNYQMVLANNFYNSLLKKRIIMLHKKRSNSQSQWKIAFIAPFLIAFVFIFNTKIVAQQKSGAKKIVKINVEVYAMGISRESSKEDLMQITENFKEKGLKVKFSGIKRNDNNEIKAIKIDAEAVSGQASAAYATNDVKGINPIQISFDSENNNLSIGSSERHNIHNYSFNDKDHNKIIKQRIHKKSDNVVFFSDDANDKHSSSKVWVNKDGDTTKIKKMIIEIDEDHDGEGVHEIMIDDKEGTEIEIIKIKNKKGDGKGNFVFISENDEDDDNTVTTYIVNGKKMSKAEFKKFDKKKIKTIEIKKEVTKKK